MSCRHCQLYTAQEVLQQRHYITTDESDGEGSELDLGGQNFDEESTGEEAGDGYFSGNEQLTDCDCTASSSESCSEKDDDDGYQPIANRQKGSVASTSMSSKASHFRSQCEGSSGSEGEDSESDVPAVTKSQPLKFHPQVWNFVV